MEGVQTENHLPTYTEVTIQKKKKDRKETYTEVSSKHF